MTDETGTSLKMLGVSPSMHWVLAARSITRRTFPRGVEMLEEESEEFGVNR